MKKEASAAETRAAVREKLFSIKVVENKKNDDSKRINSNNKLSKKQQIVAELKEVYGVGKDAGNSVN